MIRLKQTKRAEKPIEVSEFITDAIDKGDHKIESPAQNDANFEEINVLLSRGAYEFFDEKPDPTDATVSGESFVLAF